MSDIKGAVAVITGAGSGIGRALAYEMASRGAQLALADMNATTLEETRKLLADYPVRTYVLDVGDAAAVEKFASDVQRDFGRASLLVNNAGVALYGTFSELSMSEIEWLIRINFWGVVHGCKFFLPLLMREPKARIVNISSIFGLIAPAGQSAYASSKFAIRGFSECLREELRETNVRVSCVHPAGIATRIAENGRAGAATKAEDQARARERFAQVALIPPEEAARVIVQGILADKDRILIGKLAYGFDYLQRFLPVRASKIISAWMQKRA